MFSDSQKGRLKPRRGLETWLPHRDFDHPDLPKGPIPTEKRARRGEAFRVLRDERSPQLAGHPVALFRRRAAMTRAVFLNPSARAGWLLASLMDRALSHRVRAPPLDGGDDDDDADVGTGPSGTSRVVNGPSPGYPHVWSPGWSRSKQQRKSKLCRISGTCPGRDESARSLRECLTGLLHCSC